MSGTPNVIINMGYVPSTAAMERNAILSDKFSKARDFYSCHQGDDYLKYVDKGISAGDVIGYTGNNEKSSGIFNASGLLSKEQRKALRKQLQATDSVIWHSVISFTEAFGNEYVRSWEDAQEVLVKVLPKFFRSVGLREDNIVWFAGLHENTDNQHIHLSFFEKEPVYVRAKDKSKTPQYHYGKLSKGAMESLKINIEATLTNVSFDLHRDRRELTDASKSALERLYGYTDYERELKTLLLDLYRVIPTDGRVSYNSENMAAIRPQVRGIVDYIIKNNPQTKAAFGKFCSDLVKRDRAVMEMCARQKIEDFSKYLVEDRYLDDIYRRLGDKVIFAAIAIKKKETREAKKCKKNLAKKRVEKRHRQFLLERGMSLAREVDEEAVRNFEEFREKLEQAEYERLIEEGVIEAE